VGGGGGGEEGFEVAGGRWSAMRKSVDDG
jgi:hypothetical protein